MTLYVAARQRAEEGCKKVEKGFQVPTFSVWNARNSSEKTVSEGQISFGQVGGG